MCDGLKAQHIAHRIESGGLTFDPRGGAQCAAGEGFATLRAMREFEPLSDTAEYHRMVADRVASA